MNVDPSKWVLSYSQKDIVLADPSLSNRYFVRIYLHSVIRVSGLLFHDEYDDFRKWCEPPFSDTSMIIDRVTKVLQQNDILRSSICIDSDTNRLYQQINSIPNFLEITSTIQDKRLPDVYHDLSIPVLHKIVDTDGSFIFRIEFHHSIIDGYSISLFLDQFYDSTQVLSLQYVNWIQYEKTNIEYLDYHIDNDYQLDLPYDRYLSTFTKTLYTNVVLSAETIKCKLYNITSYVFFQGVVALLLHLICTQQKIITNGITSNRFNPDYQTMIGMFTKITFFQFFTKREDTLHNFFVQVKNECKRSIYSELHYISTRRMISCMLDHSFGTNNFIPIINGPSKYPISIYITNTSIKQIAHFYFEQSCFDPSTIQFITNVFSLVINQMSNPCITLDSLDTLYYYTFQSHIPPQVRFKQHIKQIS
jgi:hypothetical protein